MMKAELQSKCDLFLQNRELVQKAYRWEDSRITLLAANIATGVGELLDEGKLKESDKLLKENAGIFSDFRQNLKTVIVVKMALSADAEAYFEGVKQVYDLLSKGHLLGSEQRVLAAMSIYENCGLEGAEKVIAKTTQIYEYMKKEHPILTSDEDLPMAALLALSEKEPEELAEEMERCYQAMKDMSRSYSALQALSHVMTLDLQPTETKSEKIRAIFNALQDNGMKFGRGYELAALAILAMTDRATDTIVEDVAAVNELLKTQKGFKGLLGGANTECLMYSALLVADTYIPESDVTSIIMSGTLATVICQQVALMIVATSAAATASASN